MQTTLSIPLHVPIAILLNSEAKTLETIIVRRPTAKHGRQIAIAFGPDLAKALLAGDADEIQLRTIAEAIPDLLTAPRLTVLSEVLADMCGITAKEFDTLDVLDVWDVMKGALSFFPALQFIAPVNTQPI